MVATYAATATGTASAKSATPRAVASDPRSITHVTHFFMRSFKGPDGTEWKVDVQSPGSSNAMVIFRHRENIKRLQAGTEGRIGQK